MHLAAANDIHGLLLWVCFGVGASCVSAPGDERYHDKQFDTCVARPYMRAFATAWPDSEVEQAPLAQVTWYRNITLLEKLTTAEERLACQPSRKSRQS